MGRKKTSRATKMALASLLATSAIVPAAVTGAIAAKAYEAPTKTATENQQAALAGFALTELADTVTTDELAKTAVEEQVATALAGVDGAYSVAITEFQAAVDGDVGTPAGTAGSFKATITLADTTTTVAVTGAIAAKAYEAVEVDKAALETAISQVVYVAVSKDGKDVEKASKWTTQAAKTALEGAVTSAEDVFANVEATQEEVDEAVQALTLALQAYENAKQAGTKPLTAEENIAILHESIGSITVGENVFRGTDEATAIDQYNGYLVLEGATLALEDILAIEISLVDPANSATNKTVTINTLNEYLVLNGGNYEDTITAIFSN